MYLVHPDWLGGIGRGERRYSMLTAAVSGLKTANAEGGEVFVEEEILRTVLLEISKSAQLHLEK